MNLNMHTARPAAFAALIILGWFTTAMAADTGKSVVVVYNTKIPASREVAEHYAKAREVPADQLVGFDLPEGESMTRTEFRFQLQEPLFKKFTAAGWFKTKLDFGGGHIAAKVIESSVRYLVLCYGVPVRIQPEASLVEPNVEKLSTEMRRNEAAVDSELTWLPIVDSHPLLSGPMQNEFFRQTNSAIFNPTNGIILTARLDGPTPAIAMGLVDKALSAETNGLWGRTYFDLRGIKDGPYKLGDDWIKSAAEIARQLGWPTTEDTRPTTFSSNFPMSEIAYYVGWYDANVSGPFTSTSVDFMPGAFAYHLHSFSAANIRSATEHWVGPLLSKGATATIGYVYEPYLAGTIDLGVFTARFLHEGFSFGEAAWASSSVLSWQTTVVGDPLYRPCALTAQQQHERLAARHDPLIEWSHLRVVNLNLVLGSRPNEMVGYLEQIPETRSSAVLSEKLGDLYSEIGKPNSAASMYRKALELATHRPQRARITMSLADKLLADGKEKEAWAVLDKFGTDFPEYKGQIQEYHHMLEAAEKLKKEAEAEHLKAKLNAQESPQPAPPK